MSNRFTHLIYQTSLKLGRGGRTVLLCLAYHANDKKNLLCYPSIETLARETEMSPRQVIRVIADLQKIDILRKETHGRNNYYFINEQRLRDNQSYPQASKIGDMVSPIEDSIGDIPASIHDIPAEIGDIPARIGDMMSPNILNNIKDIKKDITKNFLENEKRREENHISTIVANPDTLANLNQKKERPTDEAKQNARKCLEEAMKKIHEGALKKNET